MKEPVHFICRFCHEKQQGAGALKRHVQSKHEAEYKDIQAKLPEYPLRDGAGDPGRFGAGRASMGQEMRKRLGYRSGAAGGQEGGES